MTEAQQVDPIIAKLDNVDDFSNLMKTIGMSAQSRARMAEEGFATMQDLLDSYSKTNDLRKLIVNLNKTFGMASGVDRAYYPATVSSRLCGIHWYLIYVYLPWM